MGTKSIKYVLSWYAIALYSLLAIAPTVLADNGLNGDPLANVAPLTDAELASLRGGFITSKGIEITIGYEQLVYMDNHLQSALAFDLSGVVNATKKQLSGLDQLFQLNVLQRQGPAADAPPALANQRHGLLNLIQNSMNDKSIRNMNVLDVGIKNAGLFQSRGMSQLLEHQLTHALR